MKKKINTNIFKLVSYLVFALGKQLGDDNENTRIRALNQLF